MKRFNIFAIALTLLLGTSAANATLVEYTFEGNVGENSTMVNTEGDTINLDGASMVVTGTTTSDVDQSGVWNLGVYETAITTFEFFDGLGDSLGTFVSPDLFFYQYCDTDAEFGCIGLDDDIGSLTGFHVDFYYAYGAVTANPKNGAVVLGSDIACDGFDCITVAQETPLTFSTTVGQQTTSISLFLNDFASIHTYSVVALSEAVPAPAGIVLLGLGLIGLGLSRRNRQGK